MFSSKYHRQPYICLKTQDLARSDGILVRRGPITWKQCTTHIPANIAKILKEKLSVVAAIYRSTNSLTENDISDAEMVSIHHLCNRQKSTDPRAPRQQRAIEMSSYACIARSRECINMKDQEIAGKEVCSGYKTDLQAYERSVPLPTPLVATKRSKSYF